MTKVPRDMKGKIVELELPAPPTIPTLNMKVGDVYIIIIGGGDRHPIRIETVDSQRIVRILAHAEDDQRVMAVSLRDKRYSGVLSPGLVERNLVPPTKEEEVLYGAKTYEP